MSQPNEKNGYCRVVCITCDPETGSAYWCETCPEQPTAQLRADLAAIRDAEREAMRRA